jgi:hypothetical protein
VDDVYDVSRLSSCRIVTAPGVCTRPQSDRSPARRNGAAYESQDGIVTTEFD